MSDAIVRAATPSPALQTYILPADAPLLVVENLAKDYRLPRERLFEPAPQVHALRGVGFTVRRGKSLGIVGESGSGKSTLARLVMALEPPTAGRVLMLGRDLHALSPPELTHARRDFQMVFQDPYGSLDPRQRVGRIVAEPLREGSVHAHRERVAQSLDAVGLRGADAGKYPHEFSGGQRQRIAIARALITRPQLIVADEPVSALDVSVQAQVLNLLMDLRDQFGVTYLLISHDLAVVDHVCDDVAVMYAGRIVEQGAPEVLFHAAAHPYTRALMRALPGAPPAPAASSISIAPVEAAADGDSCEYAARCPHRVPRCLHERPELRSLAPGHAAACHRAEDVMRSL
ncbi:MAG: oligopeptide/dipeptide ABC transporter ATP-binding protein [Burkholderiaceae bacterium]